PGPHAHLEGRHRRHGAPGAGAGRLPRPVRVRLRARSRLRRRRAQGRRPLRRRRGAAHARAGGGRERARPRDRPPHRAGGGGPGRGRRGRQGRRAGHPELRADRRVGAARRPGRGRRLPRGAEARQLLPPRGGAAGLGGLVTRERGGAAVGLADELAEFEAALARELESDVAFIRTIGEDLVRAGGKRVRPTLARPAGRMLGAPPERSQLVALAVELLHSASLLHDDLIDGAATRRGEQAAFLRYGNVVSVMSGDFMLARVLRLLARSGSDELIRLMADAAAALCEGEVLQFQCATLKEWSYEAYTRINEGKTAQLMAAAVEGVAVLAGAPARQRAALRAFGLAYGRAFQLRDDYLDLLGDPVSLGKPVGGDLREGKATYPGLRLS